MGCVFSQEGGRNKQRGGGSHHHHQHHQGQQQHSGNYHRNAQRGYQPKEVAATVSPAKSSAAPNQRYSTPTATASIGGRGRLPDPPMRVRTKIKENAIMCHFYFFLLQQQGDKASPNATTVNSSNPEDIHFRRQHFDRNSVLRHSKKRSKKAQSPYGGGGGNNKENSSNTANTSNTTNSNTADTTNVSMAVNISTSSSSFSPRKQLPPEPMTATAATAAATTTAAGATSSAVTITHTTAAPRTPARGSSSSNSKHHSSNSPVSSQQQQQPTFSTFSPATSTPAKDDSSPHSYSATVLEALRAGSTTSTFKIEHSSRWEIDSTYLILKY